MIYLLILLCVGIILGIEDRTVTKDGPLLLMELTF